MSTLFVGEQGYADPGESVFVLATLSARAEEGEQLKDQFFARRNTPRLHFGELSRFNSGRAMVLQLLSYLWSKPIRVSYGVANRRLALLGQFVETVLAPVLIDLGEDAEAPGFKVNLANLLYKELPHHLGEEKTREWLIAFEQFASRRDEASCEEFFKLVTTTRIPIDIIWLRGYLRHAQSKLGYQAMIEHQQGPGLLWGLTLLLVGGQQEAIGPGTSTTIVHSLAGVVPGEPGVSWTRSPLAVAQSAGPLTLPALSSLQVSATHSQEEPALEVAAVVAGALHYYWRSRHEAVATTDFAQKIAPFVHKLPPVWTVWPGGDYRRT